LAYDHKKRSLWVLKNWKHQQEISERPQELPPRPRKRTTHPEKTKIKNRRRIQIQKAVKSRIKNHKKSTNGSGPPQLDPGINYPKHNVNLFLQKF